VARVLVVDEDPILRLLLRVVLENDGHEVRTVGDGWDALNETDVWLPGVVVTELNLPTMGGEELIKVLRSQPTTADVRIILASAEIPEHIPVDAAFGKPYDPGRIGEAIEAMLD
jgi:two-component system, OmpR family, response regulator